MLRSELIAAAVPASPTLAANERVQAKLAAGEDVLHLAFGEAGLPVLPAIAERLAEGAARNGYGPVAGSAAAREAAAGYFDAPRAPDRRGPDRLRAREQAAALRADADRCPATCCCRRRRG